MSQTKGNPEQCKLHIQQIVRHSFGEHFAEWCGYNMNPETYEHNTLPKYLTGEGLRSDLEAIIKCLTRMQRK